MIFIAFLSLLLTHAKADVRYPTDKWQSKLFSKEERVLLQAYFADDYLTKKKRTELALQAAKFFNFLSRTMAEGIREERKLAPYAELHWPDNIEFMEYYMREVEKERGHYE